MKVLSIPDIIKESEEHLLGVDSPRLSAELLAAHALGCSRLNLIVDRSRKLEVSEVEHIRELVARRAKGEPLAYIVGVKEFYGLDFKVTPDTLIPRPETEHIVEALESLLATDDKFHFADLGTGSGILAVTVAHLFSNATGVAVDLSLGALSVALENAKTHEVNERLEFKDGDFTTQLFDDESFDLILSNPPYVTEQEYDDASREVTEFEPVTALVSGADGLDHIRAMLPHVSKALKSGGRFYVEMGWQQGDDVINFVQSEHQEFKDIRIIKDLAGRDRVVAIQKK